MRGEEGERVTRVHLNLHFRKTAADSKPAAEEEEGIVRVRSPGGDGKFAQDSQVNVRVVSRHVLPMRIVESFGPQRGA